ncbi:TIGR03085 family metal-binding protein [Kibdelosporangium philippinense]|uniref:TIGR03085 family metal-binding protein n=1 Tax=Kibdelosporangium philippinense TaxID=211113 RepID=A0ABS8ZJ31_9PSEU|nr:TIGR03085 family metal-binding protein [Kibdelosporangium philippinense]MCE7007562.1 TIGR03085 family metal-binding protein [Kibdelosporangium philippinense]
MGLASDERDRLSILFEEVGPDAPTLCDGWQTKDLAAHLVLRDRRPDAAGGIMLPALAARTQRVQDEFAAKPWAELVDLVRTGPPRWSPLSLGVLNDLANGAEYFIHHEDVRRAVPGWEPRPENAARDEALWRTLRFAARRAYHRSVVGVLLKRPDGETIVGKRGPNAVSISGAVGELMLHAFGREQARVEFSGDEVAVAEIKGTKRSF